MQTPDKIELRNPADLEPYYLNAKPHRVKLKVLRASIDRFGFDQPIVVDEDDIILKGHGRRMAAMQLGLKSVPTIKKLGLTDAQKKIIRIADNKIFEKTNIDQSEVESALRDLHDTGIDGLSEFFSDEHLAFLKEDIENAGKQSPAGTGKAAEGSLITCPKCGNVQWEEAP